MVIGYFISTICINSQKNNNNHLKLRPTRIGYKTMKKSIFILAMFCGCVSFLSVSQPVSAKPINASYYGMEYDGSFTRTQHSVTIYSESGVCKGTYAIYLHQGHMYIKFNQTWICIQGKRRFPYNGNWYVIR